MPIRKVRPDGAEIDLTHFFRYHDPDSEFYLGASCPNCPFSEIQKKWGESNPSFYIGRTIEEVMEKLVRIHRRGGNRGYVNGWSDAIIWLTKESSLAVSKERNIRGPEREEETDAISTTTNAEVPHVPAELRGGRGAETGRHHGGGGEAGEGGEPDRETIRWSIGDGTDEVPRDREDRPEGLLGDEPSEGGEGGG